MSRPSPVRSGATYLDYGPQRERYLRRGQLERDRLLADQTARGRAETWWRRCDDASCTQSTCLYHEGNAILRDREHCRGETLGAKGIPVEDIMRDFVEALVQHLLPRADDEPSRLRQSAAVESFVCSPPVRAALVRFVTRCRVRGLDPSEAELEEALLSVGPQLESLTCNFDEAATKQIIHNLMGGRGSSSGQGEADEAEDLQLKDLALEFLAAAETWRRHSSKRRSDWHFGSSGTKAQVLQATLLHLWLMHKEGCFWTEELVDRTGERERELWEEWLSRYPVTVVASGAMELKPDEVDGESEVGVDLEVEAEGRGRYMPPWVYGPGNRRDG